MCRCIQSEDKWNTYQVDDYLDTRVMLEDPSGKELVDLIIGKFSYRQAPQQNPYAGGFFGRRRKVAFFNGWH